MAKKIAVLLCGSGYLDGSEIRESVGVLWGLSAGGAEVQCFAPDDDQYHTMDCLTQTPTAETRNMLVEAARIARSQVKPLAEFRAADFHGLAIPGGFGVAKNLCSFAFEGGAAAVRPDVAQMIVSMFQARKPILAVCIAPALVGLALKDKAKLTLTLGAKGEAADEMEKLGHRHSIRPATEFEVDATNRIVTTPAYMYGDANLADIFTGISGATRAFLALA